MSCGMMSSARRVTHAGHASDPMRSNMDKHAKAMRACGLQIVRLWQQRIAEWKVESRMLATCVGHIRSRALSTAWLAWRTQAVAKHQQHKLVAACLLRIKNHQMYGAFSAWRSWTARRRVLRVSMVMSTAVSYLLSSELHGHCSNLLAVLM